MKAIPTQEQIDAVEKQRKIDNLAMQISIAAKREIEKRHKKYKQRAKNLASLKGADKGELVFERAILKERIEEIDKHLGADIDIHISGDKYWIDESHLI